MTAPVVNTDDDTKVHSNNLHQHESRANADWDAYVEKGNTLYANLENALRARTTITSRTEEWENTWNADNENKENVALPSEVGTAMHIAEQYQYCEVKSRIGDSKYIGFSHADDDPRAFVEMDVVKKNDINMPISEVSFQTALWTMLSYDEDLKKLEYIYKPTIKNPDTKWIMRQAYARSCEKGDRIVFTPDTDEFKALLASPNGAIAPRMLTDHAGFFEKTVTEIRLSLNRNMMVFRLG